LHSQLLKQTLFSDFCDMEPAKFINETNGVTPRRWMLKCNPKLSALITNRIGPGWEIDLDQLERLVPFANDPEFQTEWRAIKLYNKERLANALRRDLRI
jgi:starch phosphorylase